MTLLIMIGCLLVERYGERLDHYRCFNWFSIWTEKVTMTLHALPIWAQIGGVILPIFVVVQLVLMVFGHGLLGVLRFPLEAMLVFYCMGPHNLFKRMQLEAEHETAARYISDVNRDYFALMCWYLVTGVGGVVCYRLMDRLALNGKKLAFLATQIMDYLDWFPARVMGCCYMLVGDFHQTYPFIVANWFSPVNKNEFFLTHCAMLAFKKSNKKAMTLLQAEQLVWSALVFFFVFVALLTLAAWL